MSLSHHRELARLGLGRTQVYGIDGYKSCGPTSALTEVGVAFIREEFYRKLANEAADAIIYADAQGLIRFWNTGAERIFGFSQLDALGNTLDIIIPKRLRHRHWEGFARTIRTGITRYGAGDLLAVPAVRKDGRLISIEFTMVLFTGREGQVIGIAAILRDVSARFNEIKDLREKLATARGASS